MGEIKELRGIIPICANCKKVRDDQGYWDQVEHCIEEHTNAEFSHGICTECIQIFTKKTKTNIQISPNRLLKKFDCI